MVFSFSVPPLTFNRSSQPFDLIVNPYGGSFPYGGDSPFRLSLSRAAQEVVRYSGELFPPEPPRPMLIKLPASSCVQFDAHIDLENYTYEGSPEVTLDWAFHYFEGQHPAGSVKLQLPRR